MNRAALFNRYPEWIIGQDGASRFITHCRYPRLIAKIHRQTDSECPSGHYRHSENGITLYDFIFFDGKPADEARFAAVLTETCRRAVRNKINRNDMELGYTPYNLRTLRNRCKLTQAELAQIVGVKHYIQVGRWEAKPDTETRRTDMSLEKWRQFLDWTEKTNAV